VLAHLGASPGALAQGARDLEAAGLKKLAERKAGRLSFILWMGAAAPDGCPDCLGKPS
jgi:hypothetical protein